MASLAQAPATRERLNELVAELFGDQPTPAPQAPASLSTAGSPWQQVVAQVEAQLRTKLRVEVLPERLRKALELVSANAVTLQPDGTASVQSGKQTYTLAPDCPCADAKHRAELCKHALAVELHRRALVLFHGTAAPTPATEPAAAPAAPSASQRASSGLVGRYRAAPASCNIKLRVGNMELWYTAARRR